MKKVVLMRRSNDKLLNEIFSKFDEIDNKIADINCNLYKNKLHFMSIEELREEFHNRIGNECGEYDWMLFHKGRKSVEEYLIDTYEVNQYRETVSPKED